MNLPVRWKITLAAFSLSLITVLCFFPTLKNPFLPQWDDDTHVTLNTSIRQLNAPHLVELFRSTVHRTYIPLTTLSFAVEYHFFGFNPFIFHLDNLFLHLGVCLLIFWFAMRCHLTPRGAYFAALVFAIHPMHVESVAWVTERKDVLYAFFYMLSLLTYHRYCFKNDWRSYVLSLVLGLLSILAKPMALSLPIILWLCDWWWGRKFSWKLVCEKIPYLLYIIPIAWLTYSLNARPLAVDGREAVLTWAWTFAFYLKKFFLPTEYLALYQMPQPVNLVNPPFLTAIVILVFFGASIFILRRQRLWVAAGLFYVLSAFFLFRFQYSIVDLTFVADRYMYLPSLGFCLLLGIGLDRLIAAGSTRHILMRMALMMTIVALFGYLAARTMTQTKRWGSEAELWDHVIAAQPVSEAYDNRALIFVSKGEYDRAVEYFNKAFRIQPQYTMRIYNNRGIAFLRMGKYDLALDDFNNAVSLGSDYLPARMSRGDLYYLFKKWDLALEDYSKTVAIDPEFIPGYMNRASVWHQLKRDDMALADYDRILDLDPRYVEALRNKAIIFYLQKRYEQAIQTLDQAVRVNPGYIAGFYTRGEIYFKIGQWSQARKDFLQVLSLNPRHGAARQYLLKIGTGKFQR